MQKASKLVKTLATMQQRMSVIQKELADTEFTGTAGGGLVRVVLTGAGQAREVAIDPAVLAEDAQTAGELVMAAINSANAQKEQASRKQLSGLAGGLVPMGFKIPGV